MTERIMIKEIVNKGSIKKEGLEQYLRVVYLPEEKRGDEILPEKFRIEVGKVVDGISSKPVSFQSQSKYYALVIAKALLKVFLIMGGDINEIKRICFEIIEWHKIGGVERLKKKI